MASKQDQGTYRPSVHNPNSELKTQNSELNSEEPGAWEAIGALVLVGVLVAAILSSWNDPRKSAQYTVREAAALLYEGRYTEALPIFERALPFAPSPQTRLLLSYAYLARRDADRAEVQARIVLSDARGSLLVASWTQLGRVYALQGKSGEAVGAWRKAVEVAPSVGRTMPEVRSATWQLAMALWRQGNFDAANDYLQRLLPENDLYGRSARIKLAQLLAPTDPARSKQLLSEVSSTGNDDGSSDSPVPDMRVPGLREGLSPGAVERLLNDMTSAHSQADQARAAGIDNTALISLWGSAFLQQQEPLLAKRYLEEVVSKLPHSSDAHARIGLALLAGGDPDAALPYLLKATELDPQNALPRHALASIYMAREDWERAAVELRTLRRLEPDAIAPRLEVAQYFQLVGRYEDAEANLREAAQVQRTLGLKPGDVDASLALTRFYTDLYRMGCERGLPAAQDSLALHPGDPNSLDAVGWSLVLCGDITSALPALEEAVSKSPEVPRFRYHLAKAYLLAGRTEDARKEYTRVLDLDPGGIWERLARNDMLQLRRGEK